MRRLAPKMSSSDVALMLVDTLPEHVPGFCDALYYVGHGWEFAHQLFHPTSDAIMLKGLQVLAALIEVVRHQNV